jgi:hypothetical protein
MLGTVRVSAASRSAGPVAAGVIQAQVLNLERLVVFAAYHREAEAYERFRRLVVLTGARASLAFHACNLKAGGAPNPFLGSRYTLLIDGNAVASTAVRAGQSQAAFDVNLAPIEAGWHRIDIEGLAGGETCPTYWIFVKRGPVGEPPFTPVVRGTYDMAMAGDNRNLWVLAPARYAPQPRALAIKRAYHPPSPLLPRSELHCEHLVPVRWGDMHRPNRNVDGLLSAFDAQCYFWSTLHAARPTIALLDGPRGVGTVAMATHFSLGTAAPDGVARNNTYFCDPWRVGKIAEDGTVTTLVGYRHKGVLAHWEDVDRSYGLELVGDWSGVPPARRGFHEIWGMAWDERTLAVDESAARIEREGNEHPHSRGPVMFLADSQRDRICKIQFSGTDRSVPAKVSEFVTGLHDPWDVVCGKGILYVSERKAHRIVAYDAGTGALVRVVVRGRELATVGDDREVRLNAPLAEVQAAACVAPEGLFLQDEWLYFASKAQAQVRRVNLETSEMEVVCPVPLDGNSKFAKLAVSDGTFGPRGTTFIWTWSVQHFGYPSMHLPDGTALRAWWPMNGGTGYWKDHCGYASAGAVGQGRMITAGMVEGVLRITTSQAGDKSMSSAAERGRLEWEARGLGLLHGANGFGFYDLPLPWGLSSDIDAFLEFFGHPHFDRRG